MISFFKKIKSNKKDKKTEIFDEEQHNVSNLPKREPYDIFGESRSFDKTEENLIYQLQILNSKIDTLLAKVDNLIMRINYLENLINSIFRR
ncbi:MAG: hypothetical protein QW038_00715 [Nanopusillaceae archaeon]